ncbi:hypothetical protein K438DRAFT_2149167 [Mycena galopus ATCC 62051]|nr:hypothetical protein K438DRAFT_2149167 [Mycena galopus ATCC 62051]
MSCHEYTFHVEAPNDPDQAWQLELAYPNTNRLNTVMADMMPLGLLTDTTFPVHATAREPPMLPLMERVCDNKVNDVVTFIQTTPVSVQPHRIPNMTLLTTVLPPVKPDVSELDSAVASVLMFTESTDEGFPHSEARTSAELSHRSADGELSESDTDSMPELESASDSDASADLGICFQGSKQRDEGVHEESENIAVTTSVTLEHAVGSSVSELLTKMADGMYMSPPTGDITPTTEELLKSYTVELDEDKGEDSALTNELRDILGELPSKSRIQEHRSTASDRVRPGTPFPYTDVAASSLTDHLDTISQAAQLDPPAFYRRGKIVTRKTWSSSPPTDSANDTSSEENYDGSNVQVSTTAAWTPEFFDWSVKPKYDEEWLIESISDNRTGAPVIHGSSIPLNANQLGIMKPLPNYSLPTAGAHVIPPPIPVPTIVIEASPTEFDAPPEYSPQPDRFRDQFDPLGRMPRFALQPDQPEDVQLSLYYWAYEKALAQLDARRYKDEMGSKPIEMALRILHGPLRSYVDYEVMASEGIQTLQQLAPLTPPHSPLNLPMSPSSPISDDTPDSTQSPSSLDHSLPSTGSEITTPPDVVGTRLAEAEVAGANAHDEGDPRAVLADHLDQDIKFYLREPRTLKRKHPHDEDKSQEGCRLRIFTGAMGHGDFRLFAGVRLGGIEGVRRIEDPISNLYGITEQSFPTKYAQHPLFYEFEAAKNVHALAHLAASRPYSSG